MENVISSGDREFVERSALGRFFRELRNVRLSPLNQWGTGLVCHHQPNEGECDTHLHVQVGVVGNTLLRFRIENHLIAPCACTDCRKKLRLS